MYTLPKVQSLAQAPASSLGLVQLLMMGRDLSDMSQAMAVMILIIILGYMVDGLIFRTMERRLQEKYGLTPA